MSNVDVYFVTNRNHIPRNSDAVFGGRFNPDGVAALRFGKAKFEVDAAKKSASFKQIDVYPDPEIHRAETSLPQRGSGAFLKDIHKEMLGGRDTLMFIHGYNVSFLESLEAGALLAASVPTDVNVVVFSWPSDGKKVPFMSYYSDREDARASGPALARAYLKLFDYVQAVREDELKRRREKNGDATDQTELCLRCLHVVAHSMGNYVLRHGIQAICAKDPRKMVRLFDQVIMAAPDEDDDTFECDDKLRVLPTLARRVTVYHNQGDRALVISDTTKANPDRLGSEGPRMLDLLPKKVVIVDCSRVAADADPLSRHSYYVRCPPVTEDILHVLSDTPNDLIGNRQEVRPGRAYRIIA